MGEISRINLGLPKTNLSKETEKPAQQETAQVKPETVSSQNVDAKVILNALDTQGRANAIHFGFQGKIDPKQYLSDERIKDIEASMVQFGKGVDKHLNALNNEFSDLNEYKALKESDKLAMAAQSFAQSE